MWGIFVSGYKSTEMTEEQIKRKQQRTAKRREQAREKSEKDKVCTFSNIIFVIGIDWEGSVRL